MEEVFVNNLTWSLACGEHAKEKEQQGCGGHPVSERGSRLTRYHSIAHLSALLVQQESSPAEPDDTNTQVLLQGAQ